MVDQAELMRQVRLIQSDTTLTDAEKAHKRQALLSGGWTQRPQATGTGQVVAVDIHLSSPCTLQFDLILASLLAVEGLVCRE